MVCCVCVLLLICWPQVCHGQQVCDSPLRLQLLKAPPTRGWVKSRDLNRQSLSSWQWTKTVVKNRIPEVIYEAVCDSAYCDYPHGDWDTHESLNAVPVHQVMLVLHAERGQPRSYTAQYRRVAVGCTCMWAKMA
ncbi:interleukin 17a/f2 [Engraulis encrasicolus]|uniref:interleukin 17a/f2 n=1 Tax=Engraulis encrasicolus TaxID=184585 RepID=UPI002FD380D2